MWTALIIAAAALSGGGPAATDAAASAAVRVDDIAFRPKRLEVDRGTKVTWRFQERYVTHNVHSVGGKRFRSSRDKRDGERYAVTFRRRGTYRYVCTLHANMKGRVVVD